MNERMNAQTKERRNEGTNDQTTTTTTTTTNQQCARGVALYCVGVGAGAVRDERILDRSIDRSITD